MMSSRTVVQDTGSSRNGRSSQGMPGFPEPIICAAHVFDVSLTVQLYARCIMKRYMAYLLRIWSGDESHTPVWRASLEDPHTHQIIQFSLIPELIAYLQKLTESEAQPNSPHQESKRT